MVGDREQRLEGFLDLKAGCTDEFVFLKKKICISLYAFYVSVDQTNHQLNGMKINGKVEVIFIAPIQKIQNS